MSDFAKNKKGVKRHSLIRSLRALLRTKKGVNPQKRYPKRYAGHTYLDESNDKGLEFFAKMARSSKYEVGNWSNEKPGKSHLSWY